MPTRVNRPPQQRRRQSHWELVYAETRRRILQLELPPGTPLPEVSVAREFGVSASPARDALARLHQEGLVVAGPGRGYSVAGLSISTVTELAEARFVLETGIVRLAIQRARPEGLAHVRAVAHRVGEPGLSPSEVVERNEAFHLAIAGLTGNERLREALRRVLEDSRRVFNLRITALPGSEMTETHRELVDAIVRVGTPLPVEEFVGSDVVVPDRDTTLAEARAMGADEAEGLIPG